VTLVVIPSVTSFISSMVDANLGLMTEYTM